MTIYHQWVSRQSDPVLCPKCNQPTHREEPPLRPMPVVPQNAEFFRGDAMVRAYCKNPACDLCKKEEFISWAYSQ